MTELKDHIDTDIRVIKVAEHDRLPNTKLGYLWSQLASDYAQLADFPRAEDAYIHGLRLLQDETEARANYATLLDNLGVFYLAYNRTKEADTYLKKAFALRIELGDKMPLGISQMHLAQLDLAGHKFREAEDHGAEAQANLTAAGESGKRGLISALVTLTYARCSQKNKCVEGMRNIEQATDLARIVYPSDSLPTGHLLMAIGFAKWKTGNTQEAEKMMLEGIHIITTMNAPGAPYSRLALFEYRDFLEDMHRKSDVRRIDDQLAQSAPQPCANCTVNVNSFSNALR